MNPNLSDTRSLSSDCLPTDMAEVPAWLRARCDEHASVYDIVVYGRPDTWLAIAEVLSRAQSTGAGVEEPWRSIHDIVFDAVADALDDLKIEIDPDMRLRLMASVSCRAALAAERTTTPATPAGDDVERLTHDDMCRLSRAFNEVANLGSPQDYRINEWMKSAISGSAR